jgi:hypothetical protein
MHVDRFLRAPIVKKSKEYATKTSDFFRVHAARVPKIVP